MDYKFRQIGITVAMLFIVTVICVVIAANWSTIKRRNGSGNSTRSVSVSSEVTEEIVTETKGAPGTDFFTGTMLGDDLSAWKSDPFFFDKGEKEKVEERIEVERIPLNKRRKLYLAEEE